MDLKVFRDTLHFLNYKDSILRKKNHRKELKRYLFKSLYIDQRLFFNIRFLLKNYFHSSPFYLASNYKIHGRCVFTGKNRFIFRYFRLNRSSLKFYSSFGFISGFQKW